MYLSDQNHSQGTSQFSTRVAVLSGIALILFALIFFRLWYLQVLSGDQYRAVANDNRVSEITLDAPRGQILDANGKILAKNRTAPALQIRKAELPSDKADRKRVVERLGRAAEMKPAEIRRQIRKQTKVSLASPVTLQRDVSEKLVFFLAENQEKFPGVSVEEVSVRDYPSGSLAAHALGYVGEVSAEQLEQPRFRQLAPGDAVGQAGLEQEYDHLLRGTPGATRISVNALGEPQGVRLSSRDPEVGNNLKTTLRPDIQQVGEEALAAVGKPAAFVAMNVNTGAVLGIGSFPTYNPELFTRARIPEGEVNRLFDETKGAAITNRALTGAYPAASTFKLITAAAVLEEDLLEPSSLVLDEGFITLGGQEFKNAGDPPPAFGSINITQALKVSSDVFFYKQGISSYEDGPPKDEAIQDWAFRLGLGKQTGIDLPNEGDGLVPTPAWRNRLANQGLTDRPWTISDNINLSVGQGDLQTDPLQMAVAYAAMANGGTVVTPHVVDQVETPTGVAIQDVSPPPQDQVSISDENRAAIMEGLRQAAMEPLGTSYGTFGGYPITVAGKTGTAERGIDPRTGEEREDQAWYLGIAPYDNPEIVIAVTIEEGGFGSETAAPVASAIMSKYLGLKSSDIKGIAAPSTPAGEAAATALGQSGVAPSTGTAVQPTPGD